MPKLQENARIIDQEIVAMHTYRLRLECPEIARHASAGRFVMLRVRDGLDPLLRRPFSFHRIIPKEGSIEILYRVVGRGTELLSQCAPGTYLNLLGPLGNGFNLPRSAVESVVLVAGGIGIAPLFELMAQLADSPADRRPKAVHLFYGARTAQELLPVQNFIDLGVSIHWCTDDGTIGYRGNVTQLLEQVTENENLRPSMLYACGPLAMHYQVAKWALAKNVPTQLSLESLMACGLGACLGCALPAADPSGAAGDHYVHVCKDGPIFNAGAIQWEKIQT
ncbi:MAG: dihydroorotate dehydrogenase electron transfer subunit [Anaerolineaceae bacterium]